MLETLENICCGRGRIEDIRMLEELGENIKKASLCGLGQTAPNPVLSTIRNFRNEYEQHILDKRCPAGICKELLSYEITEVCIGCGACRGVCPTEAIQGQTKQLHKIDSDKCIKCGQWYEVCKFDAIKR